MTNTATTQIVGKAVYLEFFKPGATATTQILLLPEGVSSAHRLVPMTMLRRRLTSYQPRKTWTIVPSPHTSAALRTRSAESGAPMTESEIAAQMTMFTDPLFSSLSMNEWALYKEPIVVEVTAEDLEMVRGSKTPYKVLGRVTKVRRALGFPQAVLHVDPPVSASIATPVL